MKKQACVDECPLSGAVQCDGNWAQTCGNYDEDACLEWNRGTWCEMQCDMGNCIGNIIIIIDFTDKKNRYISGQDNFITFVERANDWINAL